MKKIITDTNIWYSIEDKKIQEIVNTDYQLVIPIIVLNELGTSPNVFISENSFDNFKTAVCAILRNIKYIKFIDLNPFEYVLKKKHNEFKPIGSITYYLKILKTIADSNYQDVKENHIERPDISGLTNFINSTSVTYRAVINKNQESKNKFNTSTTIEMTESLILKYINENLELMNNTYPKIEKLEDDNQLLLYAFDTLLREVSKTGKKIEDNDWVDLFNLTYVRKDDLYWTKEVSKQKLIEGGELKVHDLSKYLYEKRVI